MTLLAKILSVEGKSHAGKSLFLKTIDTMIFSTGPNHRDNDLAEITLLDKNTDKLIALLFSGDGILKQLKQLGEDEFFELLQITTGYGSIILVDPSDIELDERLLFILNFIKQQDLPYVVAINERQDSKKVTIAEVRASLRLDDNIPVLYCNAKDKMSCLSVVLKCLEQFPVSENSLIIIEHMKRYLNVCQKHSSKKTI